MGVGSWGGLGGCLGVSDSEYVKYSLVIEKPEDLLS